MGLRGPKPSPLLLHVLGLYRRGELATLQEGALVAGVSRQRVLMLLRAAGVDWQRARMVYVARQRTRAVMVAEGKAVKRQTRRELRLQAEHAKTIWDKQNGQAQLGSEQQQPADGHIRE